MARHKKIPAPFDFPAKPHRRVHGPRGHTSYREYKPWLRDEFQFRCVYCLTREQWYPNGLRSFSVDHVKPKSRYKKLECDYNNLVYACNWCNSYKGNDESLPDPCRISLGRYLKHHASGIFSPRADRKARRKEDESVALRLIEYLKLNKRGRVAERIQRMTEFEALRRSPNGSHYYFQFPLELPDLAKQKPPGGNSRRKGIALSHYSRQMAGRLPPHY